tara:strand:- start:126440 stop:126631 length:192 start_codon:yes stop_codon:yes gene_type:complete
MSDAEAALLEAHEVSVAIGSDRAAAIAGHLVTVSEQCRSANPRRGTQFAPRAGETSDRELLHL